MTPPATAFRSSVRSNAEGTAMKSRLQHVIDTILAATLHRLPHQAWKRRIRA